MHVDQRLDYVLVETKKISCSHPTLNVFYTPTTAAFTQISFPWTKTRAKQAHVAGKLGILEKKSPELIPVPIERTRIMIVILGP
jgi:hypothetical protein